MALDESTIQRIESTEDLDRLLKASEDRPVWIFKHSLTCPVSSAAYREFRSFVERDGGEGAAYGLVEIQKARPVSNAVAERTGIRHESPQALLLRGGEVAWHASHWSIEGKALRAAAEGQASAGGA